MPRDTRKALIIGIDHYDQIQSLSGAVSDAHSVKAALERHADGTLNFAQPRLMTATGPGAAVSRTELREAVQELFKDDAEISLLYFSGHGYIDGAGGYLCASDCASGHDGLSLNEVLTFANSSPAKNKVIILDSCHSGVAGANPVAEQVAEIKEGVTILTASTAEQYAMESGGSGVFTSLLVDALNGAAANLVGDVTPGSVTRTSISRSVRGRRDRYSRRTSRSSFRCGRRTHRRARQAAATYCPVQPTDRGAPTRSEL